MKSDPYLTPVALCVYEVLAFARGYRDMKEATVGQRPVLLNLAHNAVNDAIALSTNPRANAARWRKMAYLAGALHYSENPGAEFVRADFRKQVEA